MTPKPGVSNLLLGNQEVPSCAWSVESQIPERLRKGRQTIRKVGWSSSLHFLILPLPCSLSYRHPSSRQQSQPSSQGDEIQARIGSSAFSRVIGRKNIEITRRDAQICQSEEDKLFLRMFRARAKAATMSYSWKRCHLVLLISRPETPGDQIEWKSVKQQLMSFCCYF